MTNKEKQEWLGVKYPLTIITDRYNGTYSGGGWLAFPLYCDEVPSAVDGFDGDNGLLDGWGRERPPRTAVSCGTIR